MYYCVRFAFYFCFRRHDWLKAVGREDVLLKLADDKKRQQYRISEDHFERNCIKFSKNGTVKYLFDYTFPTLKLTTNEGASSSSTQENAFPTVNWPSNTGANLNEFEDVSAQRIRKSNFFPLVKDFQIQIAFQIKKSYFGRPYIE